MNKKAGDIYDKFYSFLDLYFSRLTKALPYSLFVIFCYCTPVTGKKILIASRDALLVAQR